MIVGCILNFEFRSSQIAIWDKTITTILNFKFLEGGGGGD